jgi:methylase of polypeptide subunit release factors
VTDSDRRSRELSVPGSTAVGRAEDLRRLGQEIATGQRLPDVLRARGASLREQVEVLVRVVELQYAAVELVDQMRAAGELTEHGGDRRSKSGPRTLKDVGLDKRRLDEWRDLRDHNALVFLRQALDAGREDTLERASVNWLIERLARIEREEEAERRRREPLEPVESEDGITTIHGDFREVLGELDPVDAIITDAPYPAEYLPLYDDLGEHALRLLKPGGLAAVMVGQAHLPEYVARLGRFLPWRWCGAYLTDGSATRIQGRKVGTKWKPLLIFGGGRAIVQDVFSSAAGDKRHHDWGQSESGMADIVDRLTRPGDLVLDPFLGAGTTAIACRDLGRRFVGCDIDAAAVATARKRLGA